MYANKKVTAIINCAGSGRRFNKNKLIQPLLSSDLVISHSVRNFILPEIDEIIVTVNAATEALYRQILIDDLHLPVKLVLGGGERYLSTYNGLLAASGEIVLLHDGVRPFVSPRMILDLLDAVLIHRAAMLAVPATTTIKLIDPKTNFIRQSLKREESWLAQTPQAFEKSLILDAYKQALAANYQIVSDDSELLTLFAQIPVKVVLGDETNLKITFPPDLAIAQTIARQAEACASLEEKNLC